MSKLAQLVAPIWGRKSSTEKWLAGLMTGLAAIAAGNSGYQIVTNHADTVLASLSDAQQGAVERSLLAGGATGFGALALIFLRQMNPGQLSQFITLAAGAMVSAALFSLGLPAWQSAPEDRGLLLLAAAAGAAMMWLLDRLIPHQHQSTAQPSSGALPQGTALIQSKRALWLMIAAISMHNLPEGFAVGTTAGASAAQADSTALAIALQNVPEGLIVATALWALGLNKWLACGAALLTGMIEPVGALLGAMLVGHLPAATPMAMACAAGAMLFVVLHEMLPESRKRQSPLRTGALLGSSMMGMWAVNQLGS